MAKIAFLGTSVTKGTSYGGVTTAQTFAYKIGIANGYAASDILNKGVNSDTSAGMLARLNTDIIANAPAVCVVEVGPNDWQNGVAIATYKSNVASIFSQLITAGIKPVALNSSMQRGPTADFLSYQAYLKAFEDAAEAAGAILLDLYREMATSYLYYTSTQFNALYVDTIHLTATGHQFVTDIAARPKYTGVFV
jgi:acyl-CoA thioesterase-1